MAPKWGRQKPYFLIGALLCSLLCYYFHLVVPWMAAGLLWILDAEQHCNGALSRFYCRQT
jgi:maltose/moltooligosaccharide transporter